MRIRTFSAIPIVFAVRTFFLMILVVTGGAGYAYEQSAEDEYVPKHEYEKLEREVEILKAQMQSLLKKKVPSKHGLKPAAAPVSQAKTQPSKSHHPGLSSPAEAGSPKGGNSQAKDNLAIAEGNREAEAEESKRALDTFLRGQTVLFKPGELVLEFNLGYTQDTTEIQNVKFSGRVVDTSLLARYGLADDLELDLTVPYGYVEQELDFRPFDVPNQVRRQNDIGIGDIGAALRYTAWHESGAIPSITFNLNAKSRTGDATVGLGTGFWNVGAGVTLLKTIDPVVFFGSVGYTSVLEQREIDPGDQVAYSIGTGFSLNDRVSFLGTVVGGAVLRTEVDGREIVGSAQDIASAQLSATIQLTKHLFVEPFVAFGLTDDAADFVVGFTIPYRFGERFPIPFFHD